MNIILASSSPRRKELMNTLGIDYLCIPSNVDETIDLSLTKTEIPLSIAREKGKDVYLSNPNDFIISADTIVYLNGEVLGKPRSNEECFNMLKKLSGKTHSVLTAVIFLFNNKEINIVKESYVTFKELNDEIIYDYIETKEPFDKAGGYAIQGIGKKLISFYSGDYNNIVGFPIDDVKEILLSQGVI